jgi:hypothetical protein
MLRRRAFNWSLSGGLALILGCLTIYSLSGGTSVRLYPVCFYNSVPSSETVNSEILPRLEQALKLQLGTSAEVVATPDARWLLARTTQRQNKALALIWPRIGCLGHAGDGNQVAQEANCVSYVKSFLENQNYLSLGLDGGKIGVAGYNEAPDKTIRVWCTDPTASIGHLTK